MSDVTSQVGEDFFKEILKAAVEVGSSDIHLKVGLPPVVRNRRELRVLSKKKHTFTRAELNSLILSILPERYFEDYDEGKEVDFAYSYSGVGRFRLNVYKHRGNPALAARYISFDIKTLDELKLPPVLKKLAEKKRGLILVTGSAGSGKSTTVAALVQELNSKRSGHIITIEDPIEYLIRDKKALITQREIGLDTESFSSGIRSSLRQDPDVIVIGELRDKDSIQLALSAAETGHLVIATLHTRDSSETVSRLVGVFPPESRDQIRWQLSACLEAIVCQKLVPTKDELEPVVEVLLATPRIKECLSDTAKTPYLYEAIEKGGVYGMQTFDQALMSKHEQGVFTRNQVIEFASRPADLELQLRGISPASSHTRGASVQSEGTQGSVEIDFNKKD